MIASLPSATSTGRRLIVAAALCALAGLHEKAAWAADITASVVDSTGQPVPGVVIVAQSDSMPPDKHVQHSAIMDQQHMQFVPRILVVQTGTAVDFPNSDQIQHQVYSFSAAKTFKLSLYAGHKYPPVIFDRPGVVTLGCNIHDGMIGYIYVTDSPFFGRSDSAGKLQLHGLPAGNYSLTAWHPQMQEASGDALTMRVVLAEDSHATPMFRLSHPVRTETPHSGDTRWADY